MKHPFILTGKHLYCDVLNEKVVLKGERMSLDEFKQMCFKKNYEGTLFKIHFMEELLIGAQTEWQK